MTAAVVAVTGATGFLGRHLVRALDQGGFRPRVLARRDVVAPEWSGLETELVVGDLGSTASLDRLCAGADVVIHVAGLIKARSRVEFDRVNALGTRAVAEAARKAEARFLLVSSLAARAPSLSDYAASKRAGEEAARSVIGEDLTIVRPPAIYGPGDLETLGLFRLAQTSPWLPVLDPKARMALIHVEDAASQIADLVRQWRPGTFALSDARSSGYGWTDLMRAAGAAVGRQPKTMRIPTALISGAGWVSQTWSSLTGTVSILSPGKAREILHLDWSLSDAERVPGALATRYQIDDGFAHSVNWYRKHGLLVTVR
jgi:nucleoside-diphosphate-sugar epimerase